MADIDKYFTKDDFKDFISLLNKHKVDYCITGAYAVSFHSEPRATRDIDIYIAHTKDNSKRVAAAIKEFVGTNVKEDYFNTDQNVILRIGIEPNQIELCNGLTGLKDNEIMRRRVKGKYDDIAAYFIGLDDLIKNKSIVKDMPHRKRKMGSDLTDYETLKKVKRKHSDKGYHR